MKSYWLWLSLCLLLMTGRVCLQNKSFSRKKRSFSSAFLAHVLKKKKQPVTSCINFSNAHMNRLNYKSTKGKLPACSSSHVLTSLTLFSIDSVLLFRLKDTSSIGRSIKSAWICRCLPFVTVVHRLMFSRANGTKLIDITEIITSRSLPPLQVLENFH